MYNSGIKYFEQFLLPLLNCTDNKKYKVVYWREIKNYGLTLSDFENFKGCSSRTFSHWRKSMLELKLIRIPKIKNKQKLDGSNVSSYNLQYVISPLGICSLTSTTKKIALNDSKKIIKILKYYSEFIQFFEFKITHKAVGNEETNRILKRICDSVQIRETDVGIQVILGYYSREKTYFEFFKYFINNNQVLLELPVGYYSDESDVIQTPVPRRIIDDNSFFGYVAEFILEAFCYSIVEDCHWNIEKMRFKLSKKDFTNQEKLEFKKTLTKYEEILDKLPFETHLIAGNFFNDKMYPKITQEKTLSDKVSDYFMGEIAPKYGYNWTIKDKK